jgi:hypothetical protein
MSQPKATMKAWIELVTGLDCIYRGDPEPSAPRPNVDASTTTYADLDFLSESSPLSTLVEEHTDVAGSGDTYVLERSDIRRGIMEVAVYGPGAADYVRSLELSVGSPSTINLLNAAGDFAINIPTDIEDNQSLRSATREPDASIQFSVEWIETADEDLAAVAEIDTTVNVTES